jgi:hypothetical protein
MKNSSGTIGNRTRDIPASSAMPQSSAPPRTPMLIMYFLLMVATLINEDGMGCAGSIDRVNKKLVRSCDCAFYKEVTPFELP